MMRPCFCPARPGTNLNNSKFESKDLGFRGANLPSRGKQNNSQLHFRDIWLVFHLHFCDL